VLIIFLVKKIVILYIIVEKENVTRTNVKIQHQFEKINNFGTFQYLLVLLQAMYLLYLYWLYYTIIMNIQKYKNNYVKSILTLRNS